MFGFANALLLALFAGLLGGVFASYGVYLYQAARFPAAAPSCLPCRTICLGIGAARPVPGGGSVPFCWR